MEESTSRDVTELLRSVQVAETKVHDRTTPGFAEAILLVVALSAANLLTGTHPFGHKLDVVVSAVVVVVGGTAAFRGFRSRTRLGWPVRVVSWAVPALVGVVGVVANLMLDGDSRRIVTGLFAASAAAFLARLLPSRVLALLSVVPAIAAFGMAVRAPVPLWAGAVAVYAVAASYRARDLVFG